MPVRAVRPSRLLVALAIALPLAVAVPAEAGAQPSARAARHHRHQANSGAAAAGACPDAYLAPAPGNGDRLAAAALCLINQQRVVHGVAPLRPDGALTGAATHQSLDMVAQDYFGHVSPSGGDPLSRIRRSGYLKAGRGYHVGENIATGTGSLSTPAATVLRWMNSPEHRANILDPSFRDTGMGVAPAAPARFGRGRGATYTEDFATIT